MSRPNQTASVDRLIMRTFDFVDPERRSRRRLAIRIAYGGSNRARRGAATAAAGIPISRRHFQHSRRTKFGPASVSHGL
jgi:hypothetical protein